MIDYRAKATKKSAESTYTKQQLVDDTRGFYALKEKTLLDDMGWVKKGKEKEYEELNKKLEKDMQLIDKGKKPTWLTGEVQDLPSGLDTSMLEEYKKKYPTKTTDEIIKAWEDYIGKK